MPSMSVALALQQEIIQRCEEHERSERSKPDFRRCVVLSQTYFIKYDCHRSLYPQYKTQQYLYETALGDTNAPRIPEVYHYFSPEHKMAYLVMEYIDAKATPIWNAPEKVAVALQWLLTLSVPDDFSIGLIGGWARHEIFRDHLASLPFSSVKALQRFMNRALERIQPHHRPKEIDFGDERLVFTQSDMHESNFFLDTNDNVCMVDFELVGVLPLSFASYTLHSGRNAFAREVVKYLDWLPTNNLHSMARVRGILWTTADQTLGLDKDGRLKARR